MRKATRRSKTQTATGIKPDQTGKKRRGGRAARSTAEWWNTKRQAAFEACRRRDSDPQAAEVAGVSESTLRKWKAHPLWQGRLAERDAALAAAAQQTEEQLLEDVLSGRHEAVDAFRAIVNDRDVEPKARVSAGSALCRLAAELTADKKTSLDTLLELMFGGAPSEGPDTLLVLSIAEQILHELLRPSPWWAEGLEIPEEAKQRIASLAQPLRDALDQAAGRAADIDGVFQGCDQQCGVQPT